MTIAMPLVLLLAAPAPSEALTLVTGQAGAEAVLPALESEETVEWLLRMIETVARTLAERLPAPVVSFFSFGWLVGQQYWAIPVLIVLFSLYTFFVFRLGGSGDDLPARAAEPSEQGGPDEGSTRLGEAVSSLEVSDDDA